MIARALGLAPELIPGPNGCLPDTVIVMPTFLDRMFEWLYDGFMEMLRLCTRLYALECATLEALCVDDIF